MYFIDNLEQSYNEQFISMINLSFNNVIMNYNNKNSFLKQSIIELIKKSYKDIFNNYIEGEILVTKLNSCLSALTENNDICCNIIDIIVSRLEVSEDFDWTIELIKKKEILVYNSTINEIFEYFMKKK